MKQAFYFFKRFFLNFFWLGLALILTSIILYLNATQPISFIVTLLIKSIETIGLSIFIASLFSFAFQSVAFQKKIQNLVENTVLKRSFLSNLGMGKKKEALRYLLKPTQREIEKYSNIEDYYNYYIEETLSVSTKNVRSNYNINIKAKYNTENDRVYTEGIYSYRLYPSEAGYTDISVGFYKDELDSTAEVLLHFPDGKREVFVCGEDNAQYEDDEILRVAKIKINEICKSYNHIDVELRVKECGQNHWMNVYFRAEQATDGFNFALYCDSDISVKTFNLFDVGHNYHVDINADKTEINIACHQWINEGSGLSVIVSRPDSKG